MMEGVDRGGVTSGPTNDATLTVSTATATARSPVAQARQNATRHGLSGASTRRVGCYLRQTSEHPKRLHGATAAATVSTRTHSHTGTETAAAAAAQHTAMAARGTLPAGRPSEPHWLPLGCPPRCLAPGWSRLAGPGRVRGRGVGRRVGVAGQRHTKAGAACGAATRAWRGLAGEWPPSVLTTHADPQVAAVAFIRQYNNRARPAPRPGPPPPEASLRGRTQPPRGRRQGARRPP